MKCPKCGYLGFDDVDRCRNCGYDFSLVAAPDPELEIRSNTASPLGLDDLALVDAAADAESASPAPTPVLTRLPFNADSADDLPLITKPSPPRAPLAVRRATPEMPRARAETPRPSQLDLPEPPMPTVRLGSTGGLRGGGEPLVDGTAPAGMLARLIAVVFFRSYVHILHKFV
jgi:hypothetical protein